MRAESSAGTVWTFQTKPSAWTLACAASTPPTRFTVLVPSEAVIDADVLAPGVSGYWCYRQRFVDVLLEASRLEPLFHFSWAYPVQLALETTPGADVLLNARFEAQLHDHVLWTETCTFVSGDAAKLR